MAGQADDHTGGQQKPPDSAAILGFGRSTSGNLLNLEQLRSIQFDASIQAEYQRRLSQYEANDKLPLFGKFINMFFDMLGLGPQTLVANYADHITAIGQDARAALPEDVSAQLPEQVTTLNKQQTADMQTDRYEAMLPHEARKTLAVYKGELEQWQRRGKPLDLSDVRSKLVSKIEDELSHQGLGATAAAEQAERITARYDVAPQPDKTADLPALAENLELSGDIQLAAEQPTQPPGNLAAPTIGVEQTARVATR